MLCVMLSIMSTLSSVTFRISYHSLVYPWRLAASSLVCATAVSLPEVCFGLKGRSSAQ